MQMFGNMHRSQSAATNHKPKLHTEGLDRLNMEKCCNISCVTHTTLKLDVLATWTHHDHSHHNPGNPGMMLVISITHRMSIAMDLIIHHISLHLTCREYIHSSNTAATAHTQSLQSHMTASAAPDAAYTPDIASALEACHYMWPPKQALMTERAESSDADHKVSAATPVPFRAAPVNRSSTPGVAPLPQKPPPPVMATVRVPPGDKLTITDVVALQKLPALKSHFRSQWSN